VVGEGSGRRGSVVGVPARELVEVVDVIRQRLRCEYANETESKSVWFDVIRLRGWCRAGLALTVVAWARKWWPTYRRQTHVQKKTVKQINRKAIPEKLESRVSPKPVPTLARRRRC